MADHRKGITPAVGLARIREAFADTTAAIYADPDARAAWDALGELETALGGLRGELAAFRAYLLAYLRDRHGLTQTELAAFAGVSPARISKILATAKERGNPVANPTSRTPQPPVVLCVITGPQGVLVADRKDKIPPVTFPGGDVDVAARETVDAAARRRVTGETGLEVAATTFIGERIHPMTSRHMIYVHAEVEPGEVSNRDPEDLAAVRWVSIDETRSLMPDMFSPVRQYLDRLQEAERGEADGG